MTVKSANDAIQLQTDLDALAAWGQKWLMEFNPDKCQVLRVTRKRQPIDHQYSLQGKVLKTCSTAKYLGLTISSDLRWNKHVDNICSKANTTLAFFRRNLRVNSIQLKTMAYFSLVRPLVEYAAPIWDPYTERNIHKLEMIQRRAAKFVLNRHHNTSSVTDMLRELTWRSLQERREVLRLVLFFKMHHNTVDFTTAPYITPVLRATRHVHAQGYQLPLSRTEQHRQSFFPRTVKTWNTLPPDVISAPSVESFRQRLMEMQAA